MKRSPIRKVSAKRAAENRERAIFAGEIAGALCAARWDEHCYGRAVHLHEPLTRARGGSITEPANLVPVCSWCHRQIHDHPEEATRRGLLRHSWAALGRDTKEESRLAGGMFEDFLTGYIGEDVED